MKTVEELFDLYGGNEDGEFDPNVKHAFVCGMMYAAQSVIEEANNIDGALTTCGSFIEQATEITSQLSTDKTT